MSRDDPSCPGVIVKAGRHHIFEKYVSYKEKEWDDFRVTLTVGKSANAWRCIDISTISILVAG